MHGNLRFAILDQLIDSSGIPPFDLPAFFVSSRGENHDPSSDYDLAPLRDVADQLASLPLDESTLSHMTELQ